MKLPPMSVLSFGCLIFTRKCGLFFDDLIISGDELFSDTYPMKLVDDCIYEVYGKVRLGGGEGEGRWSLLARLC